MPLCRAAAIVLLVAGCAGAQAELPREVLLLARIKQKMKRNLRQVPNYTCMETIERLWHEPRSQGFKTVDTVKLEVAEAGGKELFARPGEQFEERDLAEFASGGLTGNGMFALHARSLFVDDNATIRYAGPETAGSRRLERYDFRVPYNLSGFRIEAHGERATVAYHGSFWADPGTYDVFRITLEADDIPVALGVAEATTRIDYQRVPIGASEALLPRAAELVLTEFTGDQKRNRIEFTACREYGSESVISFTDAAAGTAAADLPAGLRLEMRLDSALDSAKISVGDPIRATLVEEVRQDGQVVVPKGAAVGGHIRRLEKNNSPVERYIVGIEISEVVFDHTRARVRGSLEEIGPSPGLERNQAGTIAGSIAAAQHPGVGIFFMRGSRFVLPKGLRMVWRTEAAPRGKEMKPQMNR